MKSLQFCCAASLLILSASALAEDRAYREGPVSVVTSVKVKDGQFDNYMKYLDTTYKKVMEAQKKAGVIQDYAVMETMADSADEPDLYLITTYRNMAALDNLDERSEAIAAKVTGQNRDQANSASMDRGQMREIMGSEMTRELVLK